MDRRSSTVKRETKETKIDLTLEMESRTISVSTGLPFFDHMLNAMAFHGKFGLNVQAEGDLEVDPHHLVEDTGIVLGQALKEIIRTYGPVSRFGHGIIPMDEALSEATIDASGRAFLVFKAEFPQEYSGNFHMPLLNEFFTALAHAGGLTLHLECRYGSNSHHMAEALFKALGKAIETSFTPEHKGEVLSTKGIL